MAKVMLVEDDNNLREIYEARLAAEGYEIVSAHDGEEALALAVKERPDLIISDVMMPKVSGFDMLDILRSTPETRDTKVIMMTALSQAEDRARADKLGADKYLVKSQVTLEDVVKVAHEVLEGPAPPTPVATAAPVADAATSAPAAEPAPAVSVPVAEPPAVDDTPAPIVPVTEPVSPPPTTTTATQSMPVAEPPAVDTPVTADTSTPTVPPADPVINPEPTPAPAAPFSPEQTPELPTPAPSPETSSTPATEPTPEATAEPIVAEPTPVVDPIPTTTAEQQIQDFLANSAATTPAPEQSETPATETPITDAPAAASIPISEPEPNTEPEPEPTLTPAPDTVVESPDTTIDDNQTEPQKQKKVIQPLSDMSAPSVDLDALLAKETQVQAANVPPTNTIITPSADQNNSPRVDPSTISL